MAADPHEWVKTEYGFEYRLDPVAKSLHVYVPPRRRVSGFIFWSIGIAFSIAALVVGVVLVGNGAAAKPSGRLFFAMWFVITPILILVTVLGWLWEFTFHEHIEITRVEATRHAHCLGLGPTRVFKTSEIRNLRMGPHGWANEISWSIEGVPGMNDAGRPARRTRQGLAFDLGSRYVRIARTLEDDRPGALLKLIHSVFPALVDPHDAAALTATTTRPKHPGRTD